MTSRRGYQDMLARHLIGYLHASTWDEICAMVDVEDHTNVSEAVERRISMAVDDMILALHRGRVGHSRCWAHRCFVDNPPIARQPS